MPQLDFDAFVLCASTGDLTEVETARAHADAVEFRMDLASEPLAAIDAYERGSETGGTDETGEADGPDGEWRLPLLVTYRPEWEGGAFAGAETDRLDALVEAAGHDAVGAVDLELDTLRTGRGEEVATAVRERGTAVVASVHDFERTPPRSTLRGLLHETATVGDVGKLAVTADTAADALRLLEATAAATAWGDRVATMAMGEAGRHTRAVAPVYGSRIGYAPVDPEESTAPGQYDLATLASLIERLTPD